MSMFLRFDISDDELIIEALREYAEAGGLEEPMRELDPHGDLFDDWVDELSEEVLDYGDTA